MTTHPTAAALLRKLLQSYHGHMTVYPHASLQFRAPVLNTYGSFVRLRYTQQVGHAMTVSPHTCAPAWAMAATHNSQATRVIAAPASPPAMKEFQASSSPRRTARTPSWHTAQMRTQQQGEVEQGQAHVVSIDATEPSALEHSTIAATVLH